MGKKAASGGRSGRIERGVSKGLRRGWHDGVQGGSTLWLALGGIALTLRAIRWIVSRDGEVVITERLGPGEALLITDGAEPRVVRVADIGADT